MMLHTVNKSPFERDALDSCLGHVLPGSTVLLIEDGVYAALKGAATSARIQEAMKKVKFCALLPDVEMRGLQGRVMDGIEMVDYGGFVDLVTKHSKVQSWL